MLTGLTGCQRLGLRWLEGRGLRGLKHVRSARRPVSTRCHRSYPHGGVTRQFKSGFGLGARANASEAFATPYPSVAAKTKWKVGGALAVAVWRFGFHARVLIVAAVLAIVLSGA